MYFDEPGLDDVAVLQPQWLVTAVTRLICDFSMHDLPEHQVAMQRHQRSWVALTKQGELNTDLLAVLWHDHDLPTQGRLLQLMCKFGLAVPQRKRSTYLVPALLRDSEQSASEVYRSASLARPSPDVQHTAYFVLSQRDQLPDDRPVDTAELRDVGFLPSGFFPRVLGKCIAWSQSSLGPPPVLTKSTAILSFGGDRFMLTELPEWNAIRLVLFQENVLPVERMSSLVQEVIAECMPELCCEIMLPTPLPAQAAVGPLPTGSAAYPPHDRGYLLPLSTIRREAMVTRSVGLWSGHEQLSQQQLQQQYELWLPSGGRLRCYDIMLSYRHETNHDKVSAAKLCDGCSSGDPSSSVQSDFLFGARRRHLRVFLDTIRLSAGQMFVKDIMEAELRTRVICPLISKDATRRMESHQASSSMLDFVLTEWMLAIELHKLGRVLTILPILLGELLPNGGMRNLFADRDDTGRNAFERLPSTVPTAEVAEVTAFLAQQGLTPSDELGTRTIRETVELLAQKFLAIHAWELCGDESLDLHGARLALSEPDPEPDADESQADTQGDMYTYEQCAAQLAGAVQETLKRRPEEADDRQNAVALGHDTGMDFITLPPELKFHFFLSHKQANGGNAVAWLEAKFDKCGLISWYDNMVQDRSEAGMMAGVRDSAVFVLFLTEGTTERLYVQLEIREAFRLQKPIVMIEETDDRFGKPDYAKESKLVTHTDQATGLPIVNEKQLAWLFSEVTAIPVRRQAHELSGFMAEVERQTGVAIAGGGKRPPAELRDGSTPAAAPAAVPPALSPSPRPAQDSEMTMLAAAASIVSILGLSDGPLPQVTSAARDAMRIAAAPAGASLRADLAEICEQLGVNTGWPAATPPERVQPAQPEPEPDAQSASPSLGWSEAQLAAWLRDEMRLGAVADAAEAEQVDGKTALEIEKDDWKELGASGVRAAKIVANLKSLV